MLQTFNDLSVQRQAAEIGHDLHFCRCIYSRKVVFPEFSRGHSTVLIESKYQLFMATETANIADISNRDLRIF